MSHLMKDFFKAELKTLHLKTGIRQLENIMALQEWEKQLDTLIGLMIDECQRPPFDKIGIDIKQNIIRQAVVDDKDFIGLNAKFVRRALSTWWNFNKDRYFDKVQSVDEPKQNHEPVSWDKRTEWLAVWKESLGNMETNFTSGPKLSRVEIEQEGQEKPKAHTYPSTPASLIEQRELHNRWIRECFDPYTGKKNENYIDEETWLERVNNM